jgi:hypothetical protein
MLCDILWQGVMLVSCEQHDSFGQHTGVPCEKGFTDRENGWLGGPLDMTKDKVLNV